MPNQPSASRRRCQACALACHGHVTRGSVGLPGPAVAGGGVMTPFFLAHRMRAHERRFSNASVQQACGRATPCVRPHANAKYRPQGVGEAQKGRRERHNHTTYFGQAKQIGGQKNYERPWHIRLLSSTHHRRSQIHFFRLSNCQNIIYMRLRLHAGIPAAPRGLQHSPTTKKREEGGTSAG